MKLGNVARVNKGIALLLVAFPGFPFFCIWTLRSGEHPYTYPSADILFYRLFLEFSEIPLLGGFMSSTPPLLIPYIDGTDTDPPPPISSPPLFELG